MKIKLTRIAMTAVFTALLACLSQIAVPLPFGISLTLQTFAVAVCGYCLGPLYGTLSIVVYIALGAAGAPIFSSFRGGFTVLLGLSGGFIFGFLAMALLCGLAYDKKPLFKIILSLAGLLICHIAGVIQYKFISGNSFLYSFLTVSLPFILKDIISVACAYFIAGKLNSSMKYYMNK